MISAGERLGGGAKVLNHKEYETAKRCIEETLASADTSPRLAELVYLLTERGLAPGLASTVMWEMISSGEIAMSTSRRLSLSHKAAVPA
jgi:hypothetical protein